MTRLDVLRETRYIERMANTQSPKAAKRTASQSRTETLPNYIVWKTIRDPKPTPATGQWAFSRGHQALVTVIAAKHGITAERTGDALYGRQYTFTGAAKDLDEALSEYEAVQCQIMAAARLTYDAEARITGSYVDSNRVSWQTFHNAYILGAVAAFAERDGVPAALPTPKDGTIGAIGGALFIEPAIEAPKSRKARKARPAAKEAEAAEPVTDSPIFERTEGGEVVAR